MRTTTFAACSSTPTIRTYQNTCNSKSSAQLFAMTPRQDG